MAVILKPSKGEFILQSEFSAPAFALFSDPHALQTGFFGELSRFGLRLGDVRFDQGAGTLGDALWTYQVTTLRLTIRLRLERIEMHCYALHEADVPGIKEAGMSALKLLQQGEAGVKFKTHTFIMTLHSSLENTSTKEFISSLVRPGPERLGPQLGNSIIFYYGPKEKRQSAAITFEPSLQIRDGLFARIQMVWDGTLLSISEIPDLAETQLRDVLASFALETAKG